MSKATPQKNILKNRRGKLMSGAFFAVTALFAPFARMKADNIYWDGTGTSWGDLGSWSNALAGGTDPASVPDSDDTAIFGVTGLAGVQTVNLNGSQSAQGLQFSSSGITFNVVGGSGDQTLTVGSGGITDTSGPLTIGSTTAGQRVNLSLAASQTWTSSGTGVAMYVLNDVSLANAGAQTLTLSGLNTGSKVDGIISDGLGVLTLRKDVVPTTNGAWALNGANTFSGGVFLDAGLLNIGNASALGTGTFTIAGGTSFNNTTGIANVVLANNIAQSWNGDFTFVASNSMVMGSGLVSLGTAAGTSRTVTVTANNLTVNGIISNGATANSLIKAGAGTLILGGANTYNGGVTIRAGILTLTSGTAAGTGSITIGNGTTGAQLTLTGPGVGISNSIATVGGAGVLNTISFTASGNTAMTGSIVMGSDLRIINTSTSGQPGVGTSSGGGSSITGTGNLTLDNRGASSNGALIISAASVNFDGTITHINSSAITGITRIDSVIGPNVKGLIQNTALTTLALNNANTFAADTTVTAGTLNVRNTLALQNSVVNVSSAGAVTFGNNTSVTAVTFAGLAGAGNINLNNTLTTPTAVTLTLGNSLSAGGYTGTTLNPEYSGVLSNTVGSASVIKVGTNTQTFTGENTYSGGTTVSGGTLLANNTSPTTGSATGSGNVTVTGTATIGGTGSITGGNSRSISLGATSFLMVGQSHGAGGGAQDLQLGSVSSTNVGVSLKGTLQFDIFSAGSMDDILLTGSASTYNTLGTANDLLEIYTTGVLDLNGVTVTLAANSLTGLQAGQSWKLIDWSNLGASVGATPNITLANSTFEGFNLVGTTITDGSGAGNGYYVTLVAVPEPGRAVLLLGAVMAIFFRRARLRR